MGNTRKKYYKLNRKPSNKKSSKRKSNNKRHNKRHNKRQVQKGGTLTEKILRVFGKRDDSKDKTGDLPELPTEKEKKQKILLEQLKAIEESRNLEIQNNIFEFFNLLLLFTQEIQGSDNALRILEREVPLDNRYLVFGNDPVFKTEKEKYFGWIMEFGKYHPRYDTNIFDFVNIENNIRDLHNNGPIFVRGESLNFRINLGSLCLAMLIAKNIIQSNSDIQNINLRIIFIDRLVEQLKELIEEPFDESTSQEFKIGIETTSLIVGQIILTKDTQTNKCQIILQFGNITPYRFNSNKFEYTEENLKQIVNDMLIKIS